MNNKEEIYKIEKDIVVPPHTLKIYPFRELEIGDSFFVPLDGRLANAVQNSILGACRRARFPNQKFLTRVKKNEAGERIGVRCWRIE